MESFKRRERIEPKEQPKAEVETPELRGSFDRFPISENTVRNLKNKEIPYLFPIQYETFNHIYQGADLIGRDRTGSGKTLAFALPILEKMRAQGNFFLNRRGQRPLILCLVPTRELAIQVTNEFVRFKNTDHEYRVLPVYGGTMISIQRDSLRNGAEVVVGTPGRVIDLIDRQDLQLTDIRHLILDETDQMLNIGFQEDIEKILKKVKDALEQSQRRFEEIQCLLFSATIPSWVQNISSRFMKPNVVFIDMIKRSEVKTSKTVEHLSMFIPSKEMKIPSLGDIVLIYGGAHSRAIIFTDKKEEANEVMLHGQLKVECQVLHGDIPQTQREVTFKSFRNGSLKCLVATNVAARGLDIPKVDLIIQLSPPADVESYIHRAGRTGRAGKSGTCLTFFTRKQQELMDKIEVKAHIKFRKIGAPQPSDIMRATARDVGISLDTVSPDVLEHFGENARDILLKYSPEEAIARAIAIISGYTQNLKQRSLLCSVEGYITYLIELDTEARSVTFFWNLLRKNYAPNIVDSIKGLKLLTNHRGAVFDLREEYRKPVEEVAESLKKFNVFITQAKELPDTEERSEFQPFSGGYRDGGFTNSKRDNQGSNGFGQSSFGQPSDGGFLRRGFGEANAKDETKLFVSNLAYDFSEEDLKQFIETRGFQPLDVHLVKNVDKTSKGFAYVKFSDARQAKVAFDEIGKARINGRQVRVDFAEKKN